MGDISAHFNRSEFSCKCGCSQDTVDAKLIEGLEIIREHFGGAAITISSGNRCPSYNSSVGGAISSQHLISRAADITVSRFSPEEVHAYLDTWWPGGLGKYDTFTHVDSRSYKTRWGV